MKFTHWNSRASAELHEISLAYIAASARGRTAIYLVAKAVTDAKTLARLKAKLRPIKAPAKVGRASQRTSRVAP